MLGGLKQTLCVPGPRDPTETEIELCLSVSCGGTGHQWTAAEARALGAAQVGVASALLEEVTIIPTIELPELMQDWGSRLSGEQTKPCAHQDPGQRTNEPTRVTQTCP